MPVQGYSAGPDVQISIVYNGTTYRFQTVEDWDYGFEYYEHEVPDLTTGETTPVSYIKNAQGRFTYTRSGGALERFFNLLHNAWFQNQNLLGATMTAKINNPDGTTTTVTFTKVMFTLKNAGRFHLQEMVKQGVDFRAANGIVQ